MMWAGNAMFIVLVAVVSGQEFGPGCTECDSSKALPCSKSISQALVESALTYLTAADDQEAAFAAITSDNEFKRDGGFYIFMYEFDGPCVAHGAREDFVNMTLPEIVDFINNPSNGADVDNALQAGAEAGGAWVGYDWKNNADDPPMRKIAYSAKLTKWEKDYYVGAGFNDFGSVLDVWCASTAATACAESNVVSIMGTLAAHLSVAASSTDLNAIFAAVTDQTGFYNTVSSLLTGQVPDQTGNFPPAFYAFIYEYAGTCVAHGFNSTFVGMTLPEIVASIDNPTDGQAVDDALQQGAEGGGGWVTYSWKNSADEDPYQKIAYVMKHSMAGTDYYYGVGYNQVCAEGDLTPEQMVQVCAGSPAAPECGSGNSGSAVSHGMRPASHGWIVLAALAVALRS